jgi:hypothetical protein
MAVHHKLSLRITKIQRFLKKPLNENLTDEQLTINHEPVTNINDSSSNRVRKIFHYQQFSSHNTNLKTISDIQFSNA